MSNPTQKGVSGLTQDGTTPADSQKQANKGGRGESIREEDEKE